MFELLSTFISPFLEDPKLIVAPIFLLFVTHRLTKKRKIDELLFNSRKELFTEFMAEYGKMFHPSNISAEDTTPEKVITGQYARHQKMNELVAKCRLVSGILLEERMRDLYSLIIESEDHEKFNESQRHTKSEERRVAGYEVEALMRRDLRALSFVGLIIRLATCSFLRFQFHLSIKFKKIKNLLLCPE